MVYNQEFKHKRNNRRKFIYKSLLILLMAFFIGGGVYLFYYTNFFIWQNIKITGLKNINENDLGINNNKYYIFQLPKIENIAFDSVIFHKNYLNRVLEIEIVEKKLYGIWCNLEMREITLDLDEDEIINSQLEFNINSTSTNDKISVESKIIPQSKVIYNESCFWYDSTGLLFLEAPNSRGQLIPTILNFGNESKKIGQNILEKYEFNILFQIIKILEEAKISVEHLEFESQQSKEIKVVTQQDVNIYFSLRFQPQFIKEPLDIFNKLIPMPKKIDFRSEGKVFYK